MVHRKVKQSIALRWGVEGFLRNSISAEDARRSHYVGADFESSGRILASRTQGLSGRMGNHTASWELLLRVSVPEATADCGFEGWGDRLDTAHIAVTALLPGHRGWTNTEATLRQASAVLFFSSLFVLFGVC